MNNPSILLSFIILALGAWGGVFAWWYRRYRRRKRAGPRLLNSVFLEVLVPKHLPPENREERRDEKALIGIAEQLFATLAHVERKAFFGERESLSLEIVSVGKKISFFINCPRELQDLVEKQVHAQYPTAHIDEVVPPRLTRKGAAVAAAELALQRRYFYPVKTYKQMESDPLNAVVNSLSKLSAEETGAIQLVILPARPGWRQAITKKARQIQRGASIEAPDSLAMRFLGLVARGLSEFSASLFASKKKPRGEQLEPRSKDRESEILPKSLTPMQQEAVKRLEEKASKNAFQANLRAVVVSLSPEAARAHLRNVLSAFMQYNQPPFNGFRALRRSERQVLRDFVFRSFIPRMKKVILNTEELTSLFHLPLPTLGTPNIKWLEAKRAPAPVNLINEGPLLGVNIYRGIKTEVRIAKKDRSRHMYVIGRTGTGKSEFMKNLARQDIEAGEGLAVIDPHGDLVEDLLRFVPKSRAEDVVVFEPADLDRPMGLNMLEVKTEEQKDFAIQEMIAIFYKLFPPEMIGPMFEHNMRNVMLTLMADREEPGTIAEIPRMFTDSAFQKYKLTKVSDPVVRAFWEQEMAKTTEFHKSEMLGYLISKVGRFVENEMMRNIIGQSHSAFDFRKLMDEGKILLVNLSKGKVGEVNSKLLGLIIVSKLQMAALSRADLPESARRDFYLYIDEFQNFVTDSIATILSEARKYRLNLIMAHQYISQLVAGSDTTVRDAVFGNAGTMVAFRIGVEDAEVMAKEFAPVFNEFDVINIERFNAYVKLMIDGTVSRPFNLAILPPPTGGSEQIAYSIKQHSRLKYGRPREGVREEILRRSRIGQLTPSSPDIEPSR